MNTGRVGRSSTIGNCGHDVRQEPDVQAGGVCTGKNTGEDRETSKGKREAHDMRQFIDA